MMPQVNQRIMMSLTCYQRELLSSPLIIAWNCNVARDKINAGHCGRRLLMMISLMANLSHLRR